MKHQQTYREPRGECKKHRQPLVLFCNNQGCQIAVCSACIVTKHQGHKIIDIDKKAEDIKKEVRKLGEGSQKMKDIFSKQIKGLKEANGKLKRTETKTLDNLDRTRASLYQQVDDAIEEYKETTRKNRTKFQRQIEDQIINNEKRKAKLEECSRLAEQVLHDNNPSNVISQSQSIISQYHVAGSVTSADNKTKNYYETMFFLPARHGHFAKDIVGNLVSNVEIIHMMPVKAMIFKSVQVYDSAYSCIAYGGEGEIYTNAYGYNKRFIKSFNIDGIERMCIDLGNSEEVRGLACAYISGQEILIVTTEKSIQIRKCNNGQLIHSLALQWKPGFNTVCITPNNKILVSNYFESNSKVIEYQIKNRRIVETGKSLDIPVRGLVQGLVHITHDRRQLVIADLTVVGSIVALDYQTGHQVWRIDDPTCEGQEISPAGITSDGEGHLFISDYNGRVCLMTPDGIIHNTLLKHDMCLYHQAWMSDQRRLVLRDYKNFHVCDVL